MEKHLSVSDVYNKPSIAANEICCIWILTFYHPNCEGFFLLAPVYGATS
jgi:hypothetical protein